MNEGPHSGLCRRIPGCPGASKSNPLGASEALYHWLSWKPDDHPLTRSRARPTLSDSELDGKEIL